MEKSCKEIADKLVDYADGQLSLVESNEVAEHLAKCQHCRSTLKALQDSLHLADVIWQDGLAETEAIHISIPLKKKQLPWWRYATVAASILLVVGGSIVWRALTRPAKPQPTLAEIERRIEDSASAARLLAAAELLAEYPNAQDIVKQQYRYIVETYPETTTAAKAKSRINNF